MRFPQVVVSAPDDWVANQLAPLAAEHRWLLRTVRRPTAAVASARELRPGVLLIQADPTADDPAPLAAVAAVAAVAPDVPVVVVADVKRPDDERAAWAAAAVDLGACLVLFPPLTRPVLEDAVGGLMAAAIRRAVPPGAGDS